VIVLNSNIGRNSQLNKAAN